jgi:hypothetical protein
MTHVFKSPKFHKELRMQYGPHKAISDSEENSKAASVRPGSRLQASSSKHRYTPTGILMVSCKDPKPEPSSGSSDNQ